MIVKMKFVSITGPKADIDRMVNQYLSKYEIHLENALMELDSIKNLSPYIQVNPYRDTLTKANEYAALLPEMENAAVKNLSLEQSLDLIKELSAKLTHLQEERDSVSQELQHLKDLATQIRPFENLDCDIESILNFRFIHCRFGRIAKEYFAKFKSYVYENHHTVFYKCYEDNSYIWGAYFCPKDGSKKIDAVYSSMHFERIFLPAEYKGTPAQSYHDLTIKIDNLEKELAEYEFQMQEFLKNSAPDILGAQKTLSTLSRNFDIRKLAACTKDEYETFYILCGWMSAEDAASFQKDIADDEKLYCFIDDDIENPSRIPPTRLKNPRLFKPFEMFVNMYGLPSYHEIDPTIFVGLTYAFIFGAMFGDVGQGLCLVVGGALLYKYKKLALAAILSLAGIFSTIFGFLFGSFFGFEDIIPALWLRPAQAMTSLPFLGQLNTVFVVAIAFGMFLILVTMIFHIINAIRSKDTENIFFDQNALTGLIFYGSLVTVIFLFMTGQKVPAAVILAIMFGVPLLLIMFKEPLTRLVKKQSPAIEGGKGMFLIQSFFELFEVILTYFSNTLSFIRIGAFALSHAAMMEVVLTLAGAANGDNINWLIVILGNIFVCGMEGLIVGIQVLRLEYYEMFSRFYKGNGRKFQSYH